MIVPLASVQAAGTTRLAKNVKSVHPDTLETQWHTTAKVINNKYSDGNFI